jgi:Zn-dependent protease with chaperone function
VCPYFNQLTPEWVERYAEAGADAVAALLFAFTPEDVARAFDDLEVCREAAARTGQLNRPSGKPGPTSDARCAVCSGRTTPAASRRPSASHLRRYDRTTPS